MRRDRVDRRFAWSALFVAAAGLALLAAVLVPWDWVPRGSLTPAHARDFFTSRQIHRADDYSSYMRPLSYASYAVSLLLACLLGFTPAGSRISSRLARRWPWWVVVALSVLILLTAGRLVTLPFGLLVRERNLDEGLTDQSLGGWLGDRGLSLLVSWVFTTIVVTVVVASARRSPRRWFLWAGGLAVVLTFVVSLLYPVVVEPLFNRFTPLPDGALRTAVLQVARTEGVDVDQVLVADASRRTTTLNAYVSGFGGTRRVVLYDNLVSGVPLSQARSVVAHELAHARNDDVVVGTTLAALGALVGVCALALILDSPTLRRRARAEGAGDPAVVAAMLALLALGSFVSSPAQNVVSRAIEARADRDALEATRDPGAFEAVQRQLALRSLADLSPPRWSQVWFGTHPTTLERLGLPSSLAQAGR